MSHKHLADLALPTAAPDTLLSSLLEQLNMAEQKLVIVQKDYGQEHPEVIKAYLGA